MKREIDLSRISDDTPLRLAIAADLAFPDGSMKASSLRYEAARGRLVIERIAGKDYTTLANIARMRELCRLQPKEPGSTSERPKATERPSGSSETGSTSRALDALQATAARLAKGQVGETEKRGGAGARLRKVET